MTSQAPGQRASWPGVLRAALMLAFRRPSFRVLVLLDAVAGGAGAVVPTGVDGLSPGAGVLGGAVHGLAAAATVWPVITAGLVAFMLSDTFDRGVLDVATVNRIPVPTVIGTQLLASVVGSVVALASSPLAGAAVGLGDSIRQNGGYLGAGSAAVPAGPLLLAGGYLVVLAGALAVVARRPAYVFGALLGSVLGFFILAQLAHDFGFAALRVAAQLTPWGPLWSAAYHDTQSQLSLPSAPLAVSAAVVAAWVALAVLAFWWATRPGRGRGAGRARVFRR